MEHNIDIEERDFNKIKYGIKYIEIVLYDENINIDDYIIFGYKNNIIKKQINNIMICSTLEEALTNNGWKGLSVINYFQGLYIYNRKYGDQINGGQKIMLLYLV